MTQEEVVGQVIDALERLGVSYMIAGSFASNFHGVPRMTQDADLVVELDEAVAVALVRDLQHAFYLSEEAELARRTRGQLAGRPASFASAEDTILTKLEWSRDAASARQYADALGIIRVQDASLDWAYLDHWADDLGVRELLDRARRGDPPP